MCKIKIVRHIYGWLLMCIVGSFRASLSTFNL